MSQRTVNIWNWIYAEYTKVLLFIKRKAIICILEQAFLHTQWETSLTLNYLQGKTIKDLLLAYPNSSQHCGPLSRPKLFKVHKQVYLQSRSIHPLKEISRLFGYYYIGTSETQQKKDNLGKLK